MSFKLEGRLEWSARAQGDMWVNQPQSRDPLAQRGRKSGLTEDMLSPTERSGTPYAVVGRWYERYGAGTGLGLTGSTSRRSR